MNARKEALAWYNSLSTKERDDLTIEAFGTDLVLDHEIEYLYVKNVLEEVKEMYYIEPFDGLFQSVFPAKESEKSSLHPTIEEALNYMFEECNVKEVRIRN